MTKFFATHDADGGRIAQNATIFAFDTIEAARAFLLRPFLPADRNLDTAEIDGGHFSDCWIKAQSEQTGEESWLQPFTADQLTILRPGQHPGTRAWWIEPNVEVLVVASIDERADA